MQEPRIGICPADNDVTFGPMGQAVSKESPVQRVPVNLGFEMLMREILSPLVSRRVAFPCIPKVQTCRCGGLLEGAYQDVIVWRWKVLD